jgi:hypothetical protein
MTEAEQHYEQPEEVAEEPAEQPAKEWDDNVEAEARFFGWKSPDEWEGDLPAGYIEDPRRFLERAEKFTPFRRLKEQQAEREREFEERLRKIEAVSQAAIERQERQHEAEIQRVKAGMRQAAETGDIEAYDRLSKQAEAMQKEAPKPEPPQNNGIQPDERRTLESWAAKNTWFHEDEIMQAAAVAAYGNAQKKGITDPQAALEHVDTVMRKKFPQEFGEQPQRKAAPVGDGLALGGGKKSGFESLPKEAKDAFQRFVERGLFEDTKEGREQYYNEYNAS